MRFCVQAKNTPCVICKSNMCLISWIRPRGGETVIYSEEYLHMGFLE